MLSFNSRRWAAWGVALISAVSFAAADPDRFDNHKLVEVILKNPADMTRMLEISQDHWSCSIGLGVIPFHVEPHKMADLEDSGLTYRIVHEDIQKLIDAEQASMNPRGGWFTTFHTYDEINTYMQTLGTQRPDLAQRFALGQSLENRTIYGIQITGAGGTANKPAVLFSGCQHAREWAAPSTTMFIADQLINLYDADPSIRSLLDRAVVYIVPIVNPDGYVYTWTNTRLWRKNRRNNGNGTFGVDLNRNWGTGWGLDSGSSGSGSSETYRGTAAFSEPETQVLRDFVLAHPELDAHIDFHSYSELILWAWGYQGGSPPNPAGAILADVGTRMQTSIADTHGHVYTAGPAGDTLYLASGVFPDWTFQERGLVSYTIELRPDENSPDGFILPASEIIPTGEENFAAIKELIGFIALPLTYQFPNGLPATVPADQTSTIDVVINDAAGTLNPASPTVFHRTGTSGAYQSAAMTLVSGNLYRATLPATACGSTLNYYFQAATTTGTLAASPNDAPTSVYAAQSFVTNSIFSDDMEIDRGWTVGSPSDNAPRGIWNRMNPQATTAQPEDDHTPAAGAICWVTDGNAGASAGANDVDSGQTTLTSPVIDLSSANDPRISYWRWYSNNAGGAPNEDAFAVDITNNGTTWVNVETVGPAGAQAAGGWFFHEFRVADFVTPSATTRLRFIAADLANGSLVEAAVDDFAVVDSGCPQGPACVGDVNDDGVRDLADLTALLAAFGSSSGNPNFNAGADLDNDGSITLADLTLVLSNFGVPCP